MAEQHHTNGTVTASPSTDGRWRCEVSFGDPPDNDNPTPEQFSSTFSARALSAVPKQAIKVAGRLLEDETGEWVIRLDRYVDMTGSPLRAEIDKVRVAQAEQRRRRLQLDRTLVDTTSVLAHAGWSHRDIATTLRTSRSALFDLIEHVDELDAEIFAEDEAYIAACEYQRDAKDEAQEASEYWADQDRMYEEIGGQEAEAYFASRPSERPGDRLWPLTPLITIGPIHILRPNNATDAVLIDPEPGDEQ